MRMRAAAVAFITIGALASPTQAAILVWTAALDGSQEIPPAAVPGTGSGSVRYDDATNELLLALQWQGLSGDGVQAHIHCCVTNPPGNTGIAIDLWLPSTPQPAAGTYGALYDLDSVNPFRAAFTAANGGTAASALAALMAAMNADQGRAYFNIHTVRFPGGEIRGNLAPVPEPATISLLLAGLGALVGRRRACRR